MDLRTLQRALGGDISNGQLLCPGPGHSPADRSLSIKLDSNMPDGFVVHSFAGDDPISCKDYIREKAGLPAFVPKAKKGNGNGKTWTFISEHIYRTETGEPYLRVRKYRDENNKKQYPQAHWDGKQWIKGKPAGAKVPYCLPELIKASLATTIYFCEGEKDADALIKLGLTATTASEGARAPWDDALKPHFKDRHVVILPDADEPGRKHAQRVARAINGVAQSLRILDLYSDRNDGSDVANWLEADTAGVKLTQLAKQAPLWEPSPDDGKGDNASASDDDQLIAELAALPQLQYERRREAVAKKLGVRVSVLDKLAAAARKGDDEDKQEPSPVLYTHWNVEPANEPVDGGILLRAIKEAVQRYVFMADDQAVAVALWVVFSWLHEHEGAVTHSPILYVTSAEKDSGKSTLLGVVNFLARRSLQSVDISGPALFRSIAKWQPTLIVLSHYRLELSHRHQKAAVADHQHCGFVWSGLGDSERSAEAKADRGEVPDHLEAARVGNVQLRHDPKEIAAVHHDVAVLR